MKKGDLSINIIVVAAIALLVLVILSILIFGAGRDLDRGTSCTGVGGQCSTDPTCLDISYDFEGNYRPDSNFDCPETQYCCIKI